MAGERGAKGPGEGGKYVPLHESPDHEVGVNVGAAPEGAERHFNAQSEQARLSEERKRQVDVVDPSLEAADKIKNEALVAILENCVTLDQVILESQKAITILGFTRKMEEQVLAGIAGVRVIDGIIINNDSKELQALGMLVQSIGSTPIRQRTRQVLKGMGYLQEDAGTGFVLLPKMDAAKTVLSDGPRNQTVGGGLGGEESENTDWTGSVHVAVARPVKAEATSHDRITQPSIPAVKAPRTGIAGLWDKLRKK